jgi:hypothetical protein
VPPINADSTEDLILAYPAKFQEYLHLENQLCSAHGPWLDPRERERAEYKLDLLYRFFRFDYTRQKFGISLASRAGSNSGKGPKG